MVASSQLGRDQRKVHRISRGAERRFQRAGKEVCAPSDVTRGTGALNEDLESEFVRIGKPWLCTATKVARWDEAPGPGIYGADTRAPRTQR